MWQLLLAEPILLGDNPTLCVLLRDGLGEEDLEKLSTRNRFRRALDAGLPSKTGLPGSATSYAWLYTSLAGLAPYNVFHWSLTHQNAVIDRAATLRRATCTPVAMSRAAHPAAATGTDPILASQAISFYRQLYDVEERGKTLDAAARHQLRKREAVPI